MEDRHLRGGHEFPQGAAVEIAVILIQDEEVDQEVGDDDDQQEGVVVAPSSGEIFEDTRTHEERDLEGQETRQQVDGVEDIQGIALEIVHAVFFPTSLRRRLTTFSFR